MEKVDYKYLQETLIVTQKLQELDILIELHESDKNISLKNSQVVNIQKKIECIDSETAALENDITASKVSLDETTKSIKKTELEVNDLRSKVSKYKGQLLEVKTNKEYQTMLKEIESCDEKISGFEDRILLVLDDKEKAEKKYSNAKKDFEKKIKELEKSKKGLTTEINALGREVKKSESGKKELYKALTPPLLSEYKRLIAGRNNIAVAPIVDGVCMECHIKLTPHAFQVLKRSEEIMRCPTCSRFIFYVPEKVPEAE